MIGSRRTEYKKINSCGGLFRHADTKQQIIDALNETKIPSESNFVHEQLLKNLSGFAPKHHRRY